MGKLLDKYKAEYQAAITPGLIKGHAYVVKPEIWIYCKWEEDNGVKPWEKIKHHKALTNAMMQDPELGQVLISGLTEMMGMVDERCKKEDCR